MSLGSIIIFVLIAGCKINPDTKEPIDVLFAETHITGPVIVIDITYTTGEISRMNFCYSFIFEDGVLTLTKDVAHKHTVVIENVSRIEVIAIEH